jgi:hypothetical protein
MVWTGCINSALVLSNASCRSMIALAKANEFSGAKDWRAILSFAICLDAPWRTFGQMGRDVLGDRKAAASACIALCPAITKALDWFLLLVAFHK